MKIQFLGKYGGGASRFAQENILPNTIPELAHIQGWPNSFERGTFNIDCDVSKWPEVEGIDFGPVGVKCLDKNPLFPPAAYLPYSTIPNNTLNPEKNGKFAGDLQFWKATLEMDRIEHEIKCFMLRRVKSNYGSKIEVVSEHNLRQTYNLAHGQQLVLTVYSC
jgi:hypothetical protein